MALNSRGLVDPRFAFAHRPTTLGSMTAVGRLYRPTARVDGVVWDPFNEDPALRTPIEQTTFTPIYEGRCRVQPNQDWRARPIEVKDESMVEHSTRISLPFDGNTLQDGEFPICLVGDVFRVLRVQTLGGVPADPQLTHHIHIVRNIVPSTNSWVRTLSCSTDMTKVGVLNG